MEFCFKLINIKCFHRLYLVGLASFTFVCSVLIILLLSTELREHDDFKCSGQSDSVRNECYEKYNITFNKRVPLYGYILLNAGLVLLICFIYSQFVTAKVDYILQNVDASVPRRPLQSQTHLKNKVFWAYLFHLIFRLVFVSLFLIFQWGLLYPTAFPKTFICEDMQLDNMSPSNNSNERFKSQICNNTKALPKTIAGYFLFATSAIFALSTLVEILLLFSKGRTVGFKTDKSFCIKYLNNLSSSQDDSFIVLPPLPTHSSNSRKECEQSEIIARELEDLSIRNENNLVYYYISGDSESKKNQLARQLGEHHVRMHNKKQTFVMTLNGETNESLFESYVDFVRRVGCNENVVANLCHLESSRDAKIRLLRSQIAQKMNKFKYWLIIVDKVENLETMLPLLPEVGSSEWKGGRVIVITQDTNHTLADSQFSKHLALSNQAGNLEEAKPLLSDAGCSEDGKVTTKVSVDIPQDSHVSKPPELSPQANNLEDVDLPDAGSFEWKDGKVTAIASVHTPQDSHSSKHRALSSQVIQKKDPFNDSTKLSSEEIERLSRTIVGRWRQIALLANLEMCEVENLTIDHVNYPQPINKAEKILKMISDKTAFSRRELAEHYKDVQLLGIVEHILNGTLRSPVSDSIVGVRSSHY